MSGEVPDESFTRQPAPFVLLTWLIIMRVTPLKGVIGGVVAPVSSRGIAKSH